MDSKTTPATGSGRYADFFNRLIARSSQDETVTNADGGLRADGDVHANGEMQLGRTRCRHPNRPDGAGLALAGHVRYAPASHHTFA